MTRPADADRCSYKTTSRRRDADREFLARVIALRTAGDVEALIAMQLNHRFGPAWKKSAIGRSIAIARMKEVSR